MNINGINGVNTVAGQMGMNGQMDSYSRTIQKQIANEQKQLQELSSNQEMTLEEKMKKQQEIQQKISDLNIQLRQHQIEQRKEKQQAKNASADDLFGGSKNAGNTKSEKKNTGLSTTSMTALISADGSIKQAKVQGSVATQMEGKAGVLEAEIKQDAGRGVSVEKKKEELADAEQKAQAATTASISTLADANKTMEEAAAKDEEKNVSGDKEQKESVSGAKDETAEAKVSENETGEEAEKETAKLLSAEPQRVTYTPVDIRL